MGSSLRLGLLIASLIAFSFVLFFVINKKLNIKYSIVWLLWAILTLVMAIFPETFYQFSRFVGITLPVNGVFLIMIGLLYGLTFYVYIMISKHNDEIIQLTYEIAALKKELKELKNKDER
jgi:hypothetical protein